MARGAVRGKPGVNVILVARGAIELRMSACKGKACVPAVIESCAEPAVRAGMARLAGFWEGGGQVIGRLCGSIIPLVTGYAVRAQSFENARCGALVAGLAIHDLVRPEKREAVLMVLYCRQFDVPPANGMALLTVASHLAAVKVGMTIGTLFPDIGEYQARMAFPAVQSGVHPAKRVNGFRVFEIGIGPDRFIAGRIMTVSTRDADRPVGAARTCPHFIGAAGSGSTGSVQRVASRARTIRGVVAQRRMPRALLILSDAVMAIETLELRLPTCEVVTVGAVVRTVQQRGMLF